LDAAASRIPLPVRDGATVKMLSAGLSVYRIGADGELDFVRKYDVDVALAAEINEHRRPKIA
jgi:hypothetical protein